MNRQFETECSENTINSRRVGNDKYGKPLWKVKEERKEIRKKIFGQHYNYSYQRPNKYKKFRFEEVRNTQIERQNRILLQKIQSIFKRSVPKRNRVSSTTIMKNKQSDIGLKIKDEDSLYKIDINEKDVGRRRKMMTEVEAEVRKEEVRGKKKYDGKIILYKKRKRFNQQKSYLFTIYLQHEWYKISAETEKTNQFIEMPYEDYLELFTNCLNEDHSHIFHFLTINKSTGLLQFIGLQNKYLQVVQYGEVKFDSSRVGKVEVKGEKKEGYKRTERYQGKSLTENDGEQKEMEIKAKVMSISRKGSQFSSMENSVESQKELSFQKKQKQFLEKSPTLPPNNHF